MIELSPTTALMIYLFLTLGSLLSIWGYHHYRSRNKKLIVLERDLHVCEYCQFAYLELIGKEVTKCPQCESFNKNGRLK